MLKKLSLFVVLALCSMGGFYIFSLEKPASQTAHCYCAFCDSSVLEKQTFYDGNLVCALYTHKPVMPGHCLIIPKRHVERFENLTEDEIAEIGAVIKKVNSAIEKVFGTISYLLLEKNGAESGQTVFHVHFHYMPKKAGDTSMLKFLLKNYIANLRSPIPSEQMNEAINKIKQNIS